MQKSKQPKIFIIVLTFLLLLTSVAGISYAYFSIQVTGNENASSIRVGTALLRLIYTDTLVMEGRNVYPGWSKTKTISVYNDGTDTVYYNIIWRDLLNQVINNEMIMSMTCSSDVQGNTCSGISNAPIPTTTSEVHNVSVKNNIEIEPGETHTYTVTVTFPELSTNQNYNQGKTFRGTLNIAEGSEPRTLVIGEEVTYGSEHFYVISSNSNETVLLAKYNLLVGNTYEYFMNYEDGDYPHDDYRLTDTITPSDEGYGLQSVDAKGREPNSDYRVGTVPFSGIDYWDNRTCVLTSGWNWVCEGTDGLKNKYATGGVHYEESPYPMVYDSSMSSSPLVMNGYTSSNNGYTIAYFVEEYLNRIKAENGVPMTSTARLLSYEEAEVFLTFQAKYDVDVEQCNSGGTQIAMQYLGYDQATSEQLAAALCSGQEIDGQTLGTMLNGNSISPEFYSMLGLSNVEIVPYTSFWLGSAHDGSNIWDLDSYGDLASPDTYVYGIDNGVRPVIVVPTSETITSSVNYRANSAPTSVLFFEYYDDGDEIGIGEYKTIEYELLDQSACESTGASLLEYAYNMSSETAAEAAETICAGGSYEDITLYSAIASGIIPSEYYESLGVSVTSTNAPLDVVIPSMIDGKPVTSIGMDAFEGRNLRSVVIPNTVEYISDNAFSGNQLTSIEIPNSVISIGRYAFAVNRLTSVVIPSSLSTISWAAFKNNNLTSVTIPYGVTTIGARAFDSNSIVELNIPSSVTTIGDDAFYGNRLVSVVIPNSVTSVGYNAFENNLITSLTLSNNLTAIGDYAFRGNRLTTVEIPSNVTTLGTMSFYSNNLELVKIKGKSSSSGFSSYGSDIWGWASGYSDSDIIWEGSGS